VQSCFRQLKCIRLMSIYKRLESGSLSTTADNFPDIFYFSCCRDYNRSGRNDNLVPVSLCHGKTVFPGWNINPRAIVKSLAAFTASYNLESSPVFLHGHVQFAERETLFSLSARGAQIIFVSAQLLRVQNPQQIHKTGSRSMTDRNGHAIFPPVIKRNCPRLFSGNCRGPAHCC